MTHKMPPMLNQCDGCQRGIPVINGVHKLVGIGNYPNEVMGCTADLYRAMDWATKNTPSDKIPPIFQNAMDESLDEHFEQETFGRALGG